MIWTLQEQDAGGIFVTARIYDHEAQNMGANAAAAVTGVLSDDFNNVAATPRLESSRNGQAKEVSNPTIYCLIDVQIRRISSDAPGNYIFSIA